MTTEDQLPAKRDAHLFGPGPKRILSLDGGGARGAITIAFPERTEALIEEIEGCPVRLGDWFDIIGGTSTEAIIATVLALEYRVSEIRTFTNSSLRRFSSDRFGGSRGGTPNSIHGS